MSLKVNESDVSLALMCLENLDSTERVFPTFIVEHYRQLEQENTTRSYEG